MTGLNKANTTTIKNAVPVAKETLALNGNPSHGQKQRVSEHVENSKKSNISTTVDIKQSVLRQNDRACEYNSGRLSICQA